MDLSCLRFYKAGGQELGRGRSRSRDERIEQVVRPLFANASTDFSKAGAEPGLTGGRQRRLRPAELSRLRETEPASLFSGK
jgi:hypothetical protein